MNKVAHLIMIAVVIGVVFTGMSLTEGATPKKKNGTTRITKSDARKISGTRQSTKAGIAYSKSRHTGKPVNRNNGVAQKSRIPLPGISNAQPMTKGQNKPSMQMKALKAEKPQPLARRDTKNKQQKKSNPKAVHSSKDLENGLKEGLKNGLKYGLKEGEKK